MKITKKNLKKLIYEAISIRRNKPAHRQAHELTPDKMHAAKRQFKQMFDLVHIDNMEQELMRRPNPEEYRESNLYKSSLNQIVRYYSQLPPGFLEGLLEKMNAQLMKGGWMSAGYGAYYDDYEKAIRDAKAGTTHYQAPPGVMYQ